MSSAFYLMSNGKAKIAVKATKWLLIENVCPNGELNNYRVVQVLLTLRVTPNTGFKLSLEQIFLGRNLMNLLPLVRKKVISYNNLQISTKLRYVWIKTKKSLRSRYVKSLEELSEDIKSLLLMNCGDHVIINNQAGKFRNTWGISGVVV